MLDRSMTLLRQLTQETGLTIHNVSHLKRGNGTAHEEGGQVNLAQLRGTQAIAQLSDAVIGLERNQQADNAADKNLTTVRVLKNRYAGMTGISTRLRFDPDTGRLHPEDVASTVLTKSLKEDF